VTDVKRLRRRERPGSPITGEQLVASAESSPARRLSCCGGREVTLAVISVLRDWRCTVASPWRGTDQRAPMGGHKGSPAASEKPQARDPWTQLRPSATELTSFSNTSLTNEC
jgi:hypothetical protein